MKNFFWSLLVISFFISESSYSATVNSNTQVTATNFGRLAPGTSTGTLTTACAVTGGIKSLGGCANGSFNIQATNSATTNNGRRIVIFLVRPTSLTGTPSGSITSTFTITSPLPANCTQVTAGTAIQCTNPTSTNGNVKNWTIPVYGTLSGITTSQATGDYSGAYSLRACSCCIGANNPIAGCFNACPTTASDSRCTTAALFKLVSGTIPARVVTGLGITENTQLNFGLIASGPTSGTVTQSGAKTGGITVLTDATRTAGQIKVTGEAFAGTPYTFSTISSINLTCDTGVTPSCTGAPGMPVTFSFASGTNARTLNAAGEDIVNINGTLTVGANQSSGNYKGTYTVIANY